MGLAADKENIRSPFNSFERCADELSTMTPPKTVYPVIRFEQPSDQQAIRELVLSAFRGHPHHPPGMAPTEHLIVDALRKEAALVLSLVALQDEMIVGHIAFSPIRINDEASDWFGLGPVAVHPEMQRRGIGALLIETGLATLTKNGARGVVVFGDPAYYRRFGFALDPKLVLENAPAEYFLSLRLADTSSSGAVTYHSAFSITGDENTH